MASAAPNRLEQLKTLRFANLDGAFASAFGTLVGGAFFVGFIKLCGGSDLWVGLLSALGSLLGIVQIPGAIWGRGFKSFKRFVTPGGLTWRLLYWGIVVLPLLAWSGEVKLVLMATVITVASISVLLVNPIYNDWLAEIVPPHSRGSFFSTRNAITTAVGAIVGVLGGFLLDRFKQHNLEAQGYAVTFAIGCGCGLISFYFYNQMKDMERKAPIREPFLPSLAAFATPFKDRGYRPLLIFLAVTVFAQGFPGALFAAYALETLKLPFTIILMANAFQALGIVVSSPLWGFLSDKYGNKPMLVIVGLLLALNPIPWILCRPNELVFDTALLLCTHVMMGIFWGGINLCQFNIMLNTAPVEDRANYIGSGMTVTALIGGAAPMLGAAMMAKLRPLDGAQHSYQLVFGASIVLRALAVIFLAPVREAGSTEVRTALAHIRSATPAGVLALRRLSKSTDIGTREEALEQLGDEGFALASDAMVKALNDPVPRVRRGAAQAIGRLRDPASKRQAATALIAQVEGHLDLVEEETIEALGSTEDPRAVDPLSRLLESPRSLVRRAAARALGRLGDPRATEPLAKAASSEDTDLRRAALQALRRLGSKGAGGVIADALLDPRPSVRVAAAEAVAELDLRDAAHKVRQALETYHDEGQSAMAYALGVIGQPEDARRILLAARDCTANVARRQALLGVAHLFDAEHEAYRLLLLDGMDRDTALMEALRPVIKRTRRVQVALNQYSTGDEAGSLHAMAQALDRPGLRDLAETPVDEGFLIAVAIATQTP